MAAHSGINALRLVFAVLGLLVLAVVSAHAQTTVTANIHNACGWEPSTTYPQSGFNTSGPPSGHFQRVNSGPAWSPTGGVVCGGFGSGGTYTAGATLSNYQLIPPTSGTCVSAPTYTVGNWTTSSSITDGTCTWKYVGPVDYVSFTGFGYDPGVAWSNGMLVPFLGEVFTTDPNLPVFQAQTPCISTVKPTTSNVNTTLSDGCYWQDSFVDDSLSASIPIYLYYTSKTNYMPLNYFQTDTLQGTLGPQTAINTITGYITSGTLTVVSGTAIAYGNLYGPGVAAGQVIFGGSGPTYTTMINQTVGSPGSPITMTQQASTLTVTAPPATYPLRTGMIINWAGNPSPQVNFVPGAVGNNPPSNGGGVVIVSGSGSSWQVMPMSATLSTISSTTTFIVSAEALSWFSLVSFQSGISGTSYQFNVGLLWNDQEYVGGQNGESNQLETYAHNYHYNDHFFYTWLNIDPAVSAAGYPWGYPTIIKPAPGEGFQDTFNANPSLALAGYNANNGVGLRGVGLPGFGATDNSQLLTGLQITSDTKAAYDLVGRAGNTENLSQDILEGGNGYGYVAGNGAISYYSNDLIISHGVLGIQFDYGGFSINNTIVCPAGGCDSGMDNTIDAATLSGTIVSGTLEFGFTHFISSMFYLNQDNWNTSTSLLITHEGTNNITDVASSDGVGWESCTFVFGGGSPACPGYSFPNTAAGGVGILSWAVPFKTGYTYTSGNGTGTNICGILDNGTQQPVAGVCGITNSVSPSSVFVSWPGNYKINSSSIAYGAGASYPAYSTYFNHWGGPPASNAFCTGPATICSITGNTPDVFGTARPQGSRFDTGAMELLGATGSGIGGRLFR